MNIFSKTKDGVIVELSDQELEWLTGIDCWSQKEYMGKSVELKKIRNAVQNIQNLLFLRTRMKDLLENSLESINKAGFPFKEDLK